MHLHFNCAPTTDCIIFSGNGVVLIRRKNPPFQGKYALPGGFVEENETVEAACIRETKEEVNLDIKNPVLVGIYSAPGRDPRGRKVSVAFLAEADINPLSADDDAMHAEIVTDWQNANLAFDHKQIIADAWKIKNTMQ